MPYDAVNEYFEMQRRDWLPRGTYHTAGYATWLPGPAARELCRRCNSGRPLCISNDDAAIS
jgi:hypothetical protein